MNKYAVKTGANYFNQLQIAPNFTAKVTRPVIYKGTSSAPSLSRHGQKSLALYNFRPLSALWHRNFSTICRSGTKQSMQTGNMVSTKESLPETLVKLAPLLWAHPTHYK